MRHHHPTPATITARARVQFAAELRGLLPSVGDRPAEGVVYRVLALMTCWRASLHAALARLDLTRRETAIRSALRRQIPDPDVLADRLSRRLLGLVEHPPAGGFHVAIDTHHAPYYGNRSTPGVVRGRSKASTRKFFVYATACVVERGRRYTLAVAPVPSARPDDALEPLLRQLTAHGLLIRSLALDKGFFATPVFVRLERGRIPYVVAVPHHRREVTRFLRGRSGSTAEYRMTSRARGANRVSVTIRLRTVRYRRGRTWRTEVYAVRRMGRLSDDRLRGQYRRRFGIESSYRQLRELKPPTTSRDRAWRLLLVGLALLFRQVWVAVAAVMPTCPVPLRTLAWRVAGEWDPPSDRTPPGPTGSAPADPP